MADQFAAIADFMTLHQCLNAVRVIEANIRPKRRKLRNWLALALCLQQHLCGFLSISFRNHGAKGNAGENTLAGDDVAVE